MYYLWNVKCRTKTFYWILDAQIWWFLEHVISLFYQYTYGDTYHNPIVTTVFSGVLTWYEIDFVGYPPNPAGSLTVCLVLNISGTIRQISMEIFRDLILHTHIAKSTIILLIIMLLCRPITMLQFLYCFLGGTNKSEQVSHLAVWKVWKKYSFMAPKKWKDDVCAPKMGFMCILCTGTPHVQKCVLIERK